MTYYIKIFCTLYLIALSFFPTSAEENSTPKFDERILEDPLFKDSVSQCEQAIKNKKISEEDASYAPKMEQCIQAAFSALDENTKQTLKQKYLLVTPQQKKNKLTNFKNQAPKTSSEKERSPGFNKLMEYLADKLDKAIYGEGKEKKIADHGVYYELYKNQLSKNILLVLSNFCLNAEAIPFTDTFIIYQSDDHRALTRKNNLKTLGQFDGDENNEAAKIWKRCISKVNDICLHGVLITKQQVDKIADLDGEFNYSEADKSYTKQQACLTTSELKRLKTNLSATIDIQKKLEKMFGKSNGYDTAKSMDELTTITSNEIKENYSDEVTKAADTLKKCREKNNYDDPECEKILATEIGKEDELKKGLLEQTSITAIKKDELKEKLDKDINEMSEEEKEAVKELILAERNISPDSDEYEKEKQALTDNEIQAIKNRISKSYKAEADAINKQIQAQLKLAQKKDEVKAKRTETHLNQKAIEATELIHYNNIVSGYLSGIVVGGDPDKKEHVNNTQIIKQELDNSAFTKGDGRETASDDNNWVKNIKEHTDLDQTPKEGASVSIDISKINDLLEITTKSTEEENKKD